MGSEAEARRPEGGSAGFAECDRARRRTPHRQHRADVRMSYPRSHCSGCGMYATCVCEPQPKRVGARALAAVATFLAFVSIPAWAYLGMVCPAVFLSKL